MHVQVVIVGAGPSGLALAAELRLGEIDVLVLEKLDRPTGESRGLGFTARTMELFDQRGLMPRFGPVEVSPIGHFGGTPLDYTVLPGAHFGARGIPQSVTETVLSQWASELGADIRRGCEVTGLSVDGDGMGALVTYLGPDGGEVVHADFVIGCDGGRSVVRRLGGFEFIGTEATIEMYLADVSGVDLPARQIGEKRPGGMVMSAPLGGGVDRIIVCERGTAPRRRSQPPTWDEVAGAWQRLTGQDISGGSASWVSSFYDSTGLATQYRRGPLLLAGDAAHIHLPAGGQGLSVSVQDVMNLGWKLAATVRGSAPAGLLDTYHSERQPIGQRLLTNTQAQGYLYLSGAEVEPLRTIFAELMAFPEVGRHLAGIVSGFEVTYPVGQEGHPVLGRRLPDIDLIGAAGPGTTFELMRAGRGVLLDLVGDGDLGDLAAGWADRVDLVGAKLADPDSEAVEVLAGVAALLIRPDGYVAALSLADVDHDIFRAALERWFGQPVHRRAVLDTAA